jgi:hypothetical protein
MILGLLMLSGCNFSEKEVGHYQMVPDSDGGVYVLDTRDGTVARCLTLLSGEKTWCSAKANAAAGNGPPSPPALNTQ